MARFLQLAALIPVAIAASVPHQKQALTPDMDNWINGIIKEWHTPGLGVAVVRLDENNEWQVEAKGYGVGTHDGKPVTGDSLFEIGSNSKVFTALATGLLVNNASISPPLKWTTKMKDVLPTWKLQDPVATEFASITDVMSHRTGLPRHDGSAEAGETAFDVLARAQYLKPSLEFREGAQYINLGYTVLSALPEQILNRTFTSYVTEEIFEKLGMSSSTYSLKDAVASGNMVDGFTRVGPLPTDPFGSGQKPVAFNNLATADGSIDRVICGPGGIISSPKDMGLWVQMLLLNGAHPAKNETIIPKSAIAEVTKGHSVFTANLPFAFPENSPIVYGGGQMVYHYRGRQMFEHDGSLNGFMSHVARLPNEKIGVVVLSNEDAFGYQITQIIKGRIIDSLLGLEPIDWNSRYKDIVKAQFTGGAPPTPAPASPKPPVKPLSELAGPYHSGGYGALDFCLLEPGVTPTDEKCAALAKRVKVEVPGLLENNKTNMIAPINKILSGNFLVLNHFDGNLFNATYIRSVATGIAAQPYYSTTKRVRAEVSESGLGFTGNWGAVPGAPAPSGDSAEARSEFWYNKVGAAQASEPQGAAAPAVAPVSSLKAVMPVLYY